MTRSAIPTPALLLDLDRFERNIQKMALHVKTVGKTLRCALRLQRGSGVGAGA
jgi:D-serine deaminase-like pyridoxal phosphate-dependent protein